MRFFAITLSALATFTSMVSALTDSKENPIIFPTEGTVLVAGTKATIKWTPHTPGEISLVLRKGSDADLATILTITSGAPNSGSFDWTPDASLPAGKDYAIQIIAGTLTNYSPKFTIESKTTSTGTSTSTSTSSTSTSSTSTTTTSSTSTTSKSTTSTTTETAAAGITGAANRTTTSHATTTDRPTASSSPSGTDGGAPSLNSASQLSSSFALVFCILAAMAYLN